MDVYKKMNEMGLEILDRTVAGGIYSPVRFFGNKMIYTSGTGGFTKKEGELKGKVGAEVSLEEGQKMARKCAMNIISNLHYAIGDLNQIKSFVKLLVFVNSADDFYQQPEVANGASALIKELFGDEVGMPARSAVGVNVLPGNIPVEIEVLLELK